VRTFRRHFIALLASALIAHAAGESTLSAPVKKFRLPTFNPTGFRVTLLEGDEATVISQQRIDIKEMHFTVFSGDEDNRVESTILAPTATLQAQDPTHFTVSGNDAVRVVRSDMDASGERWAFDYANKRLSMKKNVHVVFRAELKDILK
jgi:hypothetical protein